MGVCCMCAVTNNGQKRLLDALEPKLQIVVSCLTCLRMRVVSLTQQERALIQNQEDKEP